MRTHYQVLEIPLQASAAAIRKAYRERAKVLHPDKGGSGADMAALVEAYEVLRDPSRRAAYDASQQPSHALPARPAHSTVLIDPYLFLVKVFNPLDMRVQAACIQLRKALEELAYDIYDDLYLAHFGDEVTAAAQVIDLAHRTLRAQEWPVGMRTALGLYTQALRLAEDAVGDFEEFLGNFNVDLLVIATEILAQAVAQLDRSRAALG